MKFTLANLHQFCVYTHSVYGLVVYVGAGPMTRPFQAKYRNQKWEKFFNDPELLNVEFEIEIVAWFNTTTEAETHKRILTDQLQPSYNLFDEVLSSKRSRIRCVETGVIYENGAQAASCHGVTRGTISNCVNKRPGYERVKGLTFVRVD